MSTQNFLITHNQNICIMSDEISALFDLFDKSDSTDSTADGSTGDDDELDEDEFNTVASDTAFDATLIKTLVDADKCARNVFTEDNADNSRMIRNSLKHFSYYLNKHTNMKSVQAIRKLKKQNTENHESLLDADDVTLNMITSEFMGDFCGYLAEQARKYCKDDSQFLSFKSADSYLSAVKSYFNRIRFTNEHIAAFEPSNWKSIRARFHRLIYVRLRFENRTHVTAKPASNDNDAKVIAHICLWTGEYYMIEFILFQCILYQIGARGIEVGLSNYSHLSSQISHSGGDHFPLLSIHIQRGKAGKAQLLPLYTQADNKKWYEDVAALMAMVLLFHNNTSNPDRPVRELSTKTVDCTKMYLFPTFAKKLDKMACVLAASDDTHPLASFNDSDSLISKLDECALDKNAVSKKKTLASKKKQDKSTTRVSTQWATIFNHISKIFNENTEYQAVAINLNWGTVTPLLTSYNGRKRCAQEMAELGACPISIIYRVGWECRSIHSLFDYVHETKPLQKSAGKILSGWLPRNAIDNDAGGVPPLAHHCYSEVAERELQEIRRNKIQLLQQSLFGYFTDGTCSGVVTKGISNEVASLLLGGLMKHWNEIVSSFLNVGKTYDEFWLVKIMRQHWAIADIDEVEFSDMCAETLSVFTRKNIFALPSNALGKLADDISIDVRPLKHNFDQMTRAIKDTTDCHIKKYNEMDERMQKQHSVLMQIVDTQCEHGIILRKISDHIAVRSSGLSNKLDSEQLVEKPCEHASDPYPIPTFSFWLNYRCLEEHRKIPVIIFMEYKIHRLETAYQLEKQDFNKERSSIGMEELSGAKKTGDLLIIKDAQTKIAERKKEFSATNKNFKHRYKTISDVHSMVQYVLEKKGVTVEDITFPATHESVTDWMAVVRPQVINALRDYFQQECIKNKIVHKKDKTEYSNTELRLMWQKLNRKKSNGLNDESDPVDNDESDPVNNHIIN